MQTSATTQTNFKSQGLVVDKATGGGMYYGYIDTSSNLYYSSINEVTFVKNYEYYFNLVISTVSYISTTPWMSVTCDN